mgnify:CR=1 FL=1
MGHTAITQSRWRRSDAKIGCIEIIETNTRRLDGGQPQRQIREAREGNIEEARKLLVLADEDLHSAHRAQTQLLTQEARGNAVAVNVILVHAQDHLTGAMLIRDLAEEFIELYVILAAKN